MSRPTCFLCIENMTAGRGRPKRSNVNLTQRMEVILTKVFVNSSIPYPDEEEAERNSKCKIVKSLFKKTNKNKFSASMSICNKCDALLTILDTEFDDFLKDEEKKPSFTLEAVREQIGDFIKEKSKEIDSGSDEEEEEENPGEFKKDPPGENVKIKKIEKPGTVGTGEKEKMGKVTKNTPKSKKTGENKNKSSGEISKVKNEPKIAKNSEKFGENAKNIKNSGKTGKIVNFRKSRENVKKEPEPDENDHFDAGQPSSSSSDSDSSTDSSSSSSSASTSGPASPITPGGEGEEEDSDSDNSTDEEFREMLNRPTSVPPQPQKLPQPQEKPEKIQIQPHSSAPPLSQLKTKKIGVISGVSSSSSSGSTGFTGTGIKRKESSKFEPGDENNKKTKSEVEVAGKISGLSAAAKNFNKKEIGNQSSKMVPGKNMTPIEKLSTSPAEQKEAEKEKKYNYTKVVIDLSQVKKQANGRIISKDSEQLAPPKPKRSRNRPSKTGDINNPRPCNFRYNIRDLPQLFKRTVDEEGDETLIYTCLECGETLDKYINLCRHRRKFHWQSMNGKTRRVVGRRYVCSHCPEEEAPEFEKKDHVKGHIEEVHPFLFIFHCDYPGCAKKFLTGANLRQHSSRTHPSVSLQCVHCGEMCKNDNTLRHHLYQRHEKTQTFVTCSICGDSIPRGAIGHHKKTRHSNHVDEGTQMLCDHCGKSVLRSRMAHHIAEAHPGYNNSGHGLSRHPPLAPPPPTNMPNMTMPINYSGFGAPAGLLPYMYRH